MKISEIFRSIQGESTWAGLPCVFVRLAGCNLACRYCDTEYARTGGDEWTCSQIVERADSMGAGMVEITGGEPLMQPECPDLCQAFLDRGRLVLLETNGTLPIDSVPDKVIRIVDIKCPGSGFPDAFDRNNVERLGVRDEVKFVLTDRTDYEWAREVIVENDLPGRVAATLMSPAHSALNSRTLAEWILDDGLEVRLQLQVHKIIWGPEKRGV